MNSNNYIHALKEYLKRTDVFDKALPITEEFTKLIFCGIIGKRNE
ncbi:hypothetical protein [Pueribacillus sp. YX66]